MGVGETHREGIGNHPPHLEAGTLHELARLVYRQPRGYQLGEGAHIVFQLQVSQRQVVGVQKLTQRRLEWKGQEELALGA